MFKVAVLKMKDIIKYAVGIVITILAIICISRYFSNQKENAKEVKQKIEEEVNTISNKSLTKCIEKVIPVASIVNKEYNDISEEDDQKTEKNYFQEILKTQISTIKGLETIEEKELKEIEIAKNEEEKKQEENSNKLETNLDSDAKTEVVTKNPIAENFNAQYGNVKIKNQTSNVLTTEIMTPDITIENKNIVLFHTHSCESYTPSQQYQYTSTGTFRTTDLNFTVTRVGTELEKNLKQYGYNVIHDTSYHDYPAYNGSYTRSLKTVENILQTTPSDIIIDIHRDAIGSRSDYAPTVKIGEDYAAQLMFVIGTNGGGLFHPNWNQNLKFAIKIQEKAEELYPGLFKPIMLTNSRYNQHTGKFASIIEVGATGNTLEQCLNSMKYLAIIMKEVI